MSALRYDHSGRGSHAHDFGWTTGLARPPIVTCERFITKVKKKHIEN